MTNVCDCTRPCGDAFACATCAKTARENLVHIADLAAALDEKRAKIRSNWDVSNLGASKPARKWRTDDGQALTHAASPTFRPSGALGFDPRVSRVADRVHKALVGIVRELPDRVQKTLRTDAGPSEIARWLVHWVKEIRLQETAGKTFALIGRIVGDLHRLFDNPPPKLFLGECKMIDDDGDECHESIYLDADKVTSTEVACPRCGITHDVAERRKALMQGVDDYLGTAKEISRLLRQLAGADVTERRIREYAGHGLLTRMGSRREYGRDGQPHIVAVYRIGQVRAVVVDVQERRDKRRAEKVRRHLLDKHAAS